MVYAGYEATILIFPMHFFPFGKLDYLILLCNGAIPGKSCFHMDFHTLKSNLGSKHFGFYSVIKLHLHSYTSSRNFVGPPRSVHEEITQLTNKAKRFTENL